MNSRTDPDSARDALTSYFWSTLADDTLRSRSVSDIVLSGTLDIPAASARLNADWAREIATHLALGPGDVEQMPLARARARWPEYSRCVKAASDWAAARGLPNLLAGSDVALMACRGARYHHDGEQYGESAFCNLFVSEDKGQVVHFPALDLRIPLTRGTVLIFDTCQPHAVIPRDGTGFHAGDFPVDRDGTQLFLTWELPVEDPRDAQALRIAFDVEPPAHDDAGLLRGGAPASVDPESGCWRDAAREGP